MGDGIGIFEEGSTLGTDTVEGSKFEDELLLEGATFDDGTNPTDEEGAALGTDTTSDELGALP